MTYIEKLAEKIGVKEAMRAAFAGCPGDLFSGAPEYGHDYCFESRCGRCWTCETKEGEDSV